MTHETLRLICQGIALGASPYIWVAWGKLRNGR